VGVGKLWVWIVQTGQRERKNEAMVPAMMWVLERDRRAWDYILGAPKEVGGDAMDPDGLDQCWGRKCFECDTDRNYSRECTVAERQE